MEKAFMLNTGRPKDHARLTQFIELNALNRAFYGGPQ